MRTLLGLSSLAVAVALGLCLGAAAPARAADPTKAKNPHWQAATCKECHGDGKPAGISVADTDALCLKCHDGKAAEGEVHSIGRPLAQEGFAQPAGWPLHDGRVACLTCHDVTLACSPTATRQGNAKLLRASPPSDREKPFCKNCHQADIYRKFNPHVMLAAGAKEILKDQCLVCHTQVPDNTQMTRTGNASLTAPERELCRSCHGAHKDETTNGHLGKPMKPEMQAFLAAREAWGLAKALNPDLLKKLQASGAKPRFMLTDSKGQITCTTCHNPHERGVFPAASTMTYGAMRLTGREKLTTPVRNEQWCQHCHDF